jgi:hypothetical protein
MDTDAVVALVEPVEIWFMWRPQLRDPGDELVPEAAEAFERLMSRPDGAAPRSGDEMPEPTDRPA